MAQAGQRQDQNSPKNPPEPAAEKAEEKQEHHGQLRHADMALAEQRVRDVAAVELAGGEEIDRGHEEADPSRSGNRMEGERFLREAAESQVDQKDK